ARVRAKAASAVVSAAPNVNNIDEESQGRTLVSPRHRRGPAGLPRSRPGNYAGQHRAGEALNAAGHGYGYKKRFRGECFRCLQPGHRKAECRDPLWCTACKLVGHLARQCPSKRRTASGSGNMGSRGLSSLGAARSGDRPGEAHRRPLEDFAVITSSPAMGEMTGMLRATAMVITAHAGFAHLSNVAIGRALVEDLHLRPEVVARDLARDAGVFTFQGVPFTLSPWTPTQDGTHYQWKYYCRLAVEKLPLQAWNVRALQELPPGKCLVDCIEEQSESLHNAEFCFVWVWAFNPDRLPRVLYTDIVDTIAEPRARHGQLVGHPRDDGREGPKFRVLVHLDTTKDFSPLEPLSPVSVAFGLPSGSLEDFRPWPVVERFSYTKHLVNGIEPPPPPRASVHSRLGAGRRDEDADRGGDGRGSSRRRFRSWREALLRGRDYNARADEAVAPTRSRATTPVKQTTVKIARMSRCGADTEMPLVTVVGPSCELTLGPPRSSSGTS
ncbi:hypothetical protein BRADI_1g75601v3, partial [Brachypodium distachyon]